MSERARRWCAGVVLVVQLLVVEQATADPLSEAEAAKVFEEGLAAFDRGEPALAVKTWNVLLEAAPTERAWRIHYNLGLAFEAMGERARAIESFEAFSRRVGEQPGSLPIAFEERRQDAVERAQRLRPFVGLLRINPPASGEVVLVSVRSARPEPAGFSRYVEPGEVHLVMGDGPRALDKTVKVPAGTMVTVIAEQLPPPKAPPPPPYEPPIPNAVIGVLGGVAVLSLGVPIGLYLRAADLEEDAASLPTFSPDYIVKRESFEAARTEYQASFAVPAGLAALTLALLVANVVDASNDDVARVEVGMGPQGSAGFTLGFRR